MNQPFVIVILLLLLAVIVVGSFIMLFQILSNIRSVQSRRHEMVSKRDEALKEDGFEGETVTNLGAEPTSMLAVLGSGGHTAEMMTLMSEVFEELVSGRKVPVKVTYVSGQTDHHSVTKFRDMHTNMGNIEDVSFVKLPRAREVGQSWTSSVWTSLHTAMWACLLIFKLKPHLIVINGPGTSAVVAGIAFLQRCLLQWRFQGRCRVIYVESFARVETLSLSGKLVYNFADRFIVQWKQLCKDWPLAEYYGRLC